MKNLTYVQGEISTPVAGGPQIIAHVCNDLGLWCGETARQISRRWPEVEMAFHRWYRRRTSNDFGLGTVQFVSAKRTHVNRVVRVANMVAQRGTKQQPKSNRFRAHAIAWCLAAVGRKAVQLGASVHLPTFDKNQPDGSVLDVQSIIRSVLCDNGISVFIYQNSVSSTGGIALSRTMRPAIRRRFELFDSWYVR